VSEAERSSRATDPDLLIFDFIQLGGVDRPGTSKPGIRTVIVSAVSCTFRPVFVTSARSEISSPACGNFLISLPTGLDRQPSDHSGLQAFASGRINPLK
jgi:hypothetical protein